MDQGEVSTSHQNSGLLRLRSRPEISLPGFAGRAGKISGVEKWSFQPKVTCWTGRSHMINIVFAFTVLIIWDIYICYREVSKYRWTKRKNKHHIRENYPKEKHLISHLELISFKQNTIYSFMAVVNVSYNTDQLTYSVIVPVTIL